MAEDLIGRVARKAEQALTELRQRAADESWDEARLAQEKSLFELRHEVTLCSVPGCTEMVHPIPGFRDLRCPRHESDA